MKLNTANKMLSGVKKFTWKFYDLVFCLINSFCSNVECQMYHWHSGVQKYTGIFRVICHRSWAERLGIRGSFGRNQVNWPMVDGAEIAPIRPTNCHEQGLDFMIWWKLSSSMLYFFNFRTITVRRCSLALNLKWFGRVIILKRVFVDGLSMRCCGVHTHL